MGIHRIHLPRTLETGARIVLDESASNHLLRVLRLKTGARLIVFNGEGGEYEAELIAIERKCAVITLTGFMPVERESPLRVTLVQGISRGERMDYTLQKSVELGVTRIIPVETEFSQVRLDGERLERRLQHWRGVIAGAGEQCGRTRLPELAPVVRLADWLAGSGTEPGVKLVLDPDGAATLSQLSPAAGGTITLLIGPEGGLSRPEIQGALAAAYSAIRLGPRVLRTETAGVAALAALQTLWGDLA